VTSGSQEARKPGSQEARKPGSQEARKPGSQEARKPGSAFRKLVIIVSSLRGCGRYLSELTCTGALPKN
jgi:hypothetical protein